MSRSKTALSDRSSTITGSPETRTQPAMPRSAGKRLPTRKSSPSPETASKTSSAPSGSSPRIEAARPPKTALAASTTERSSSRCPTSESVTARAVASAS